MKRCRRYRVSGHVQGVLYRAGTQQTAQQLGLTGWVRNLADGRVELVACGEPAALVEFEAWLRQGPRHARVENVTVSETPLQTHNGFSIAH